VPATPVYTGGKLVQKVRFSCCFSGNGFALWHMAHSTRTPRISCSSRCSLFTALPPLLVASAVSLSL